MLLAINRFRLIGHIIIGYRDQVQVRRHSRGGKYHIQRNPPALERIEGLCRHNDCRYLLCLLVEGVPLFDLLADTEVKVSPSSIIMAMGSQHVTRRFNLCGYLCRYLLKQVVIQAIARDRHLRAVQIDFDVVVMGILHIKVLLGYILRPVEGAAHPDVPILPSHRRMRVLRRTESRLA